MSAEIEALRRRYNAAVANGLGLHARVLLRRLEALERRSTSPEQS